MRAELSIRIPSFQEQQAGGNAGLLLFPQTFSSDRCAGV
jgi:hypothetical protein